METVSWESFQHDPQRYLHRVSQDLEPLLIANREPSQATVLMSRQAYDGLLTTMDILSQPELAAKIRRGRQQIADSQKN